MERREETLPDRSVIRSGCQAIHGCPKKGSCERYQRFLESTPFRGFNANQTCITTEYLHYIQRSDQSLSAKNDDSKKPMAAHDMKGTIKRFELDLRNCKLQEFWKDYPLVVHCVEGTRQTDFDVADEELNRSFKKKLVGNPNMPVGFNMFSIPVGAILRRLPDAVN